MSTKIPTRLEDLIVSHLLHIDYSVGVGVAMFIIQAVRSLAECIIQKYCQGAANSPYDQNF